MEQSPHLLISEILWCLLRQRLLNPLCSSLTCLWKLKHQFTQVQMIYLEVMPCMSSVKIKASCYRLVSEIYCYLFSYDFVFWMSRLRKNKRETWKRRHLNNRAHCVIQTTQAREGVTTGAVAADSGSFPAALRWCLWYWKRCVCGLNVDPIQFCKGYFQLAFQLDCSIWWDMTFDFNQKRTAVQPRHKKLSNLFAVWI